ncbi:hypothetical protein CI15_19040 [Paraburkholderia monticola]|uniref:Uncharacterized protein n=1 Tax=Paraburkholderia monticola TaxID=1399968 RepID=A0A149PN88_9BURK|nr:hypothetical protein CI15_19040 [Paraburkholderia monticola]
MPIAWARPSRDAIAQRASKDHDRSILTIAATLHPEKGAPDADAARHRQAPSRARAGPGVAPPECGPTPT